MDHEFGVSQGVHMTNQNRASKNVYCFPTEDACNQNNLCYKVQTH